MKGSKANSGCYGFEEKGNNYFYNLEKVNHKKKHIASLTKEDGNIVHEPKQILEDGGTFFQRNLSS